MGWFKKRGNQAAPAEIDDFKGPPPKDPINPERVSRRIGDINGVVTLALLGGLIYSMTWNLNQKDHVQTHVIFVGFSDDAKRSFYIMAPRDQAVEQATMFAKEQCEEYIRNYNELISDPLEMSRRWNQGGWVWARSAPALFAKFQIIATKAWNVLSATKVEQHVKDAKCTAIGSNSMSGSFTSVQVDERRVERNAIHWNISMNYDWLTTMPADQADKNPVGWIVTDYEASIAP